MSQRSRLRRQVNDDNLMFRRVQYLIHAGLISKACRTLSSRGIAPLNSQTLNQVQALFPHRQDDLNSLHLSALASTSVEPDIKEKVILRICRSFSRGFSTGPTGLRAEFLQLALSQPTTRI